MITWLENLMRNSKHLHRIYYSMPVLFKEIALNLRAMPLIRLRYSKKTFECLDKLMERDTWNYEKLLDFVEEQQSNIIEISKEIPYYKKVAKKASSLRDFPILNRESVRNNYALMVNIKRKPLIELFTSGSTGSGLPVFYDKETYIYNWAYMMKQYIWAGVDPRDWRITFFGPRVVLLERDKPPFWIKNHYEHQYLVSIFHISDKNAEHYVKFLDEQQGSILEGFPTALYPIAQYVKALKGKLKFSAVFSTGEPLYPFMRKEIEEAFDAKVYDSYGMTECAGLIMECDKGGYHVMMDNGYLEIIRENEDLVNLGEEGYFIWTGFTNIAMPFIRYKIGDKGIRDKENCFCGKPYPLVKPTVTRDSDYLIASTGRLLSPRAVNQVLKNKVSFRACQFIQLSKKEILLRIVPDKKSDFRKELKEVNQALKEMAGEGVFIMEEIAEEPIRRGRQGKIPLIISQVKL